MTPEHTAQSVHSTGRRLTRIVRGVRFSFAVPKCCWEPGPVDQFRNGRLFISQSTRGPRGAEAIVFWTSFPQGDGAKPCTNLRRRPVGRSAADLVSAMTRTPGIERLDGPVKVAVGGRPATYVVLRILVDLGCDPGFFFTWRPRGPGGACWGACWLESSTGDTIRVWIVDVGGKRLVFQAETTTDAGAEVEQEIRQIVRSIRFSG